jgi:transcription elongation GreA/GreB family factor
MNKRMVIRKIQEELAREMATLVRAAQAAHAEATHEQSKAENKYDTRGLEASYLARGQSKQARELRAAMEDFEKLEVRKFGPDEAIDVGALVELEHQGERAVYFIGPRGGGTEVVHDHREVLVITPQSPLGEQLQGKKQGERLQLDIAGARSDYSVLTVE